MTMKTGSLFFGLWLFSTPAWADDPAWVQAQAVDQATASDVAKTRSLQSIAPHVAELEKELADGAATPPALDADGKMVMLTDSPAESLAAMAEAATKKQSATAQPNPYPDIALLLALYYNEMHRFDDALRVIDAGLKLAHTQTLGQHLPHLFSERANAYGQMKRSDQALAVCDAGLTLPADKDMDRARFQRCRGFNLTELGRLDDAENAYNESLKLEPNNALATRELAYIARLKAGGTRAPTEQVTTHLPQDATQPDGTPANQH
jgi:tetratricopeptide (TPR) repeat protein